MNLRSPSSPVGGATSWSSRAGIASWVSASQLRVVTGGARKMGALAGQVALVARGVSAIGFGIVFLMARSAVGMSVILGGELQLQ